MGTVAIFPFPPLRTSLLMIKTSQSITTNKDHVIKETYDVVAEVDGVSAAAAAGSSEDLP